MSGEFVEDLLRSAFDEHDPCPFYGRQLICIGEPLSTIASVKGRINRCGLFTVMYTVCLMQADGLKPRWKECALNPSNRKRGVV